MKRLFNLQRGHDPSNLSSFKAEGTRLSCCPKPSVILCHLVSSNSKVSEDSTFLSNNHGIYDTEATPQSRPSGGFQTGLLGWQNNLPVHLAESELRVVGGSTPSSRLLNYAYLLTVPILSLFEDRTLLSTLKRILEDTGPFICPSSKCTLFSSHLWASSWGSENCLSVWPLAVCMHSLWNDFFNLPCSLLQSHDGPSSWVPTSAYMFTCYILKSCHATTYFQACLCFFPRNLTLQNLVFIK